MHEISAGVIVFRRKNKVIQYLLLHYLHGRGYWDFSKGHLENGETEKVAAIRELNEEAGITDINMFEDFKEKISYHFMNGSEKSFKEVTYFLAETTSDKVIISEEHIGFIWADYEKSMDMIMFENTKNILEQANNTILGLK